ncbi:unnamed protein product [Spirodela intermedia]|uniref:Uncharacterized protein n=1 Tax=Spirodela intermedia TaxID=51605 RepID=A0A7I8LIB9_SPIIN|nr:unnamed protein product [Spirodela intermedia]
MANSARGMIRSQVKWRVESSILLYLLGECAHSTLSDDIPYITLEGRPVELNVANVQAIYVQQVDSLAEGVCHHILLALLVAKDEGEVLQEVMAPVFESLNDGVKLTIVSGVSKPHVIQFLAEVLYGMAFLTKDTPNTDSNEAPDVMHAAWPWPGDYRADLFGVCGNSSLRDDKTEEHNPRSEETTLLRMGIKLLLSKCLKHLS